MADRHRYEGYGPDRDRWRDRDHDRAPGWRADDEQRSWISEDYGQGGAERRPPPREDPRHGARRDTGETWGQGRAHREQGGREDFGHYGGQTGAGGDYGHAREGRNLPLAAGQGMTFTSAHGDFEPDYLHWRNTQMQKLDQEYLRWREERRSKFAKDFDEWRRTQGGIQGQHFPTGQMQTAGQGSSGGVASEPTGAREDKKKS